MLALLFLLADLWLIFVGFFFGWRFIRRYGNYLLGLEWLVVGVSATNFLVGSLFSGSNPQPFLNVAYLLDAFSRSLGITLILVLGLMAVTHGFKPRPAVDVVIFAGAALVAYLLAPFHDDQLHVPVATFFLVMNLLTTIFLAYVVTRLWAAGARALAGWTAVVTAAGTFIALTYDFFPLPFDDADRTVFYTLALLTWGAQGFVYFYAYRALDRHNSHLTSEVSHNRLAAHS
ncbi:MAG: hypothetical protein ACK5MT_09930 [Actinomycetales bacterium]